MDYETALHILDEWDYRSLPDGERVINAIAKAKEAIRQHVKPKRVKIAVLGGIAEVVQRSRNVEVTIKDYD